MFTDKDIQMICERISRLYQLQVPLSIDSFTYDEPSTKLAVTFKFDNETNFIQFEKNIWLSFNEFDEIIKIIVQNPEQYIKKD